MWILVIQRIAVEAFLDLIYFPLWWYSGGALHAARSCFGLLKDGNQNLAPGLWLTNLFVPMFGQYDWQGRIISFFMRLVQLIARSIALFVWLQICIILWLVWLALPIAVVYGLTHSFTK